MSRAPAIRAVFFDVGETLIDETRIWSAWADELGVPRLTFLATIGALIERRVDHHDVFEHFRPGFDLKQAIERRLAAGYRDFGSDDLYPDAIPCLRALREAGYLVGVAGNQPARAEALLRDCRLPLDVVATSDGWGVEKPAPEFFARVAASVGLAPPEVAYVGDRVDNDVVPAAAAGMLSVFLRRGPWGHIQAGWPEARRAHLRVESLAELPAALQHLRP